MEYRQLGASGVRVSEVSMGCNRLGETIEPDAHWDGLVGKAVDLGVNLFDTAEQYAKGRSEEVLGRALGGRDDVLIATKYSPLKTESGRDCSTAVMVAALEKSLRRLRRDRVDVYQVHSPSRKDLEASDWADGMARLKTQGKIRLRAVAIGKPDDGVWLIENGLVEALQVTYNLFETAAAERLLPLAKDRGVGILARMPLARGLLTGKFRAGEAIPKEHRAAMDGDRAADRLPKVESLRPYGARYPGGLTRLAHHFCLSHPGVSCIIPGARSIAQLEENVAASNGHGLPAEALADVERLRKTWS